LGGAVLLDDDTGPVGFFGPEETKGGSATGAVEFGSEAIKIKIKFVAVLE
jgi:hypothetical protein